MENGYLGEFTTTSLDENLKRKEEIALDGKRTVSSCRFPVTKPETGNHKNETEDRFEPARQPDSVSRFQLPVSRNQNGTGNPKQETGNAFYSGGLRPNCRAPSPYIGAVARIQARLRGQDRYPVSSFLSPVSCCRFPVHAFNINE